MFKSESTFPFIFVGLTLALSGCHQEVDPYLTQHQFEIGGRLLTISLPSEFQRDLDAPLVQFLRSGYRVPRLFRFTTDLPPLGDSYERKNLIQGGELRYNIVSKGSGSGGTEVELWGVIVLKETKIGIIATDQDEFSPNPQWCIEFLHTLRFK